MLGSEAHYVLLIREDVIELKLTEETEYGRVFLSLLFAGFN